MEKLIVLNNERVSQQNGKFFSRNYNFKILPEGLNKYFDVEYIVRKSNVNESHELNLNTVKIATNIIQFIFFVISTFKNKNTRYYIICITPYTFIASLFLFIFRKKVFVYLISSGHEEWKNLLGSWSVWIYNFMYQIVTSNSTVIALHDRLYDNNKKFHVINSSSLDENWLMNFKEAKIDKIRFLYVARINPVKGINEFLEMFKDIELDAELSIIGKTNNLKHQKEFKTIMKNNKNIKFPGYISNRQDLINTFDEHNILILPSYTEGQPYVVDESLARRRPVLIFEDIKHIIKGRKGIFVSKRNITSLTDTTKFIMTNYNKIQKDIEKNKFPLEKDMFKEISNVILND
jgi:glycosyltransferase involved in cell wall biosynthesis